jgi:acyl-CoA thioester hydrolase
MTGAIERGVHAFPVRVYYEDTDSGAIVYYANYLKFAERARTEMLRALGFEHRAMAGEGVSLAVRRCTVDYLAPAQLDDALVVQTSVLSAAGAALELEQEIWRGEALLVRVRLTVACLSGSGRPRRLPPALAEAAATLSRTSQMTVRDHAN